MPLRLINHTILPTLLWPPIYQEFQLNKQEGLLGDFNLSDYLLINHLVLWCSNENCTFHLTSKDSNKSSRLPLNLRPVRLQPTKCSLNDEASLKRIKNRSLYIYSVGGHYTCGRLSRLKIGEISARICEDASRYAITIIPRPTAHVG